MPGFPRPHVLCLLLCGVLGGVLGPETECEYGARSVRTPASPATSLYSMPDDFPRPPRPYLRHNSAHGLALHHVVPHWMLKRFFNRVCRRNINAEVRLLGTLLTRMLRAVLRANGMLLDVRQDEVDDALRFAAHMTTYDARAPKRPPPSDLSFGRGWCLAVTFFSWLPGDLFFGPAPFLRRDDPREQFDVKAANIMELDQYELLVDLYRKLGEFLRVPAREFVPTLPPFADFVDVVLLLDTVLSHRLLYLYHPDDWNVFVNNKFIA